MKITDAVHALATVRGILASFRRVTEPARSPANVLVRVEKGQAVYIRNEK